MVFPLNASLFTIFLTVLSTSSFFVLLLKDEESINIFLIERKKSVFNKNLDILSVFFFIFLGYTISFSLWFSFLPEASLNLVFSEQLQDLSAIRSLVSGSFVDESLFKTIFFNNLRVLTFCLFFSFVYGAGSILILSWNASILGSAIGLYIRDKMGGDFTNQVAVYLINLPQGLGQYLFHGSFEILAYFIGSFAGGIISASVVRKRYKSRNFLKLLKNIIILIIVSILLLVIAAYIEVRF